MPGLSDRDKRENSQGTARRSGSGGLTINTSGLPAGMSQLQAQVESLQNRVNAPDYSQAAGPLGLVYAEYTTAAGQNITTGSYQTVNYGTLARDTHNTVTTGTSWLFRAPMTKVYTIACGVGFAPTTNFAAGEWAALMVYKNGASGPLLQVYWSQTTGVSQLVQMSGCVLMLLLAGETISIQLQQRSGNDLALTTTAGYNWVAIAG